MQLFTHRRISIPTSSHHETIKNQCKTGNPAHTAWRVSFGRPAVHIKNPETDANAQRRNSPNLDFLRLAVTLASSPLTPMPSFAFPSTQPPKTSLKTLKFQ